MQKRNLKDCRIGLFLGALLFALAGCADKKDGSASCMNQLNAEQYQSVAENTNCSNYERASGFLGLAGMSFSNFMKKGASDNLTNTLGITSLDSSKNYTSGNRKYLTKALCLVGPDNITSSSRCTSETKGTGTRGVPEREISFFSILGDMIYLNYGVLDTDLNGDISKTETDNFSGSSSSTTNNSITSNSTFEIIKSSNRYIFTDNMSNCTLFTDNYTITPTSTAVGSDNCTVLLSSGVEELRPIYKLDNMTDITGGTDLTPKIDMVSELTSLSSALDSELGAIGLSDNSSLRTSLTENLKKLDNGGLDKDGNTCTNASALDLIYLLVEKAADNSTVSVGTNLYEKNILSISDLVNEFSISEPQRPSGVSSSITFDKVRLIYASNEAGSSHKDSYEAAHSKLQNAVKAAVTLGAESSSKGDGKVIYRELLCIGDN